MTAEHYAPFWPEACEHSDNYVRVPPWHLLEAQSVAVRDTLVRNEAAGKPGPRIGDTHLHRRSFGTIDTPIPVERFDLRNIFCFQYLPPIYEIRERAAQVLSAALRRRLPPKEVEELQQQTRNEHAHSLYQHAMWRRNGRRVYVLDTTTYILLANTPLPDLPCSILSMPQHSFYLVLPKDTFNFGVWNPFEQRIDRQPIEGVMVSMDNIEPDSPRPRELAFLTVGRSEGVEDRNIAYISMGLGPDAKLSDIRMPDASSIEVAMNQGTKSWRYGADGGYELGIIVPRVILGFLLYLASEHPDIEPVPPAPRRTFAEIRSPKQRQAALENQNQRLRNATRLPILYVGRHLAAEVEAERQALVERESTGRTWALDHAVMVRGHWRQQPYGEGRTQRRLVWIRPYWKGPDMAESLKVQAAKVQRAQPAVHEP